MKKGKKIFLLAAAAVVAVFLFFFIRSVTGVMKKFSNLSAVQRKRPPYPAGCSSFAATRIADAVKDSVQLRGVVVINFWATWCKPCLEEAASLEKLQQMYPQVKVIKLSLEDIAVQQQFLAGKPFSLPAYLPADTSCLGTPVLYPRTLVLHNNTVTEEIYGPVDWTEKENRLCIDTLLLKSS